MCACKVLLLLSWHKEINISLVTSSSSWHSGMPFPKSFPNWEFAALWNWTKGTPKNLRIWKYSMCTWNISCLRYSERTLNCEIWSSHYHGECQLPTSLKSSGSLAGAMEAASAPQSTHTISGHLHIQSQPRKYHYSNSITQLMGGTDYISFPGRCFKISKIVNGLKFRWI